MDSMHDYVQVFTAGTLLLKISLIVICKQKHRQNMSSIFFVHHIFSWMLASIIKFHVRTAIKTNIEWHYPLTASRASGPPSAGVSVRTSDTARARSEREGEGERGPGRTSESSCAPAKCHQVPA